MFKHVPNILTMCRFVLIPFIFGSIVNNQYVAAFVFLTLSGITDILDGFIARKFNLITNFGKLIDPLADKATQISTLIALLFAGIIPDWILIVVFIKETIMIAGASVMFYVAIVASLITNNFNLAFHIDIYIYYVALALTIFALIMYFKEFYQKGYVNKEELSTVDKKVIEK